MVGNENTTAGGDEGGDGADWGRDATRSLRTPTI